MNKYIAIEMEEKRTLGVVNGKYSVPDDIDECNDEIAEMFGIKYEKSYSFN